MLFTIGIGAVILYATYLIVSMKQSEHKHMEWARGRGCTCSYGFWGRTSSVNCPIPEHSAPLKYSGFLFGVDQLVTVAGYAGVGIIQDIRAIGDNVVYSVLFYDVPRHKANMITQEEARSWLGHRLDHFLALGVRPSLLVVADEERIAPYSREDLDRSENGYSRYGYQNVMLDSNKF